MSLGAGSFKRWAIVRNADTGLFGLQRLFENEVATQVPDSECGDGPMSRGEAPLVEISRDGLTVETVRGTVWSHHETDGEKALRELRRHCAQLDGLARIMES